MGLEGLFFLFVILYGIYEASKNHGAEMWAIIIAVTLLIAVGCGIISLPIPIQ